MPFYGDSVSDNSDGVVPPTGSVRPPLSDVARSGGGLVCNQVQLQTAHICVPSSRPKSLGSGCPDSILGRPEPICLSSCIPSWQTVQQIIRSPMQKSDPDSPGLAQHAPRAKAIKELGFSSSVAE